MRFKIMAAYMRAIKAFRPDPRLTITTWADKYRILPSESSAERGRYRSDRVPYMVEIMDELSPWGKPEEVVLMGPTQIGKTEAANNLLFAVADLWPGPCLMALPTIDLAKKHSKKKIQPSVRAVPRLADKVSDEKSRASGNTILLKEFPGGSWEFCGANAPSSMRSVSIRYLILDDIDGFPETAGKEGSPVDLFKRRTDSFGSRRKIFICSTPTDKGVSPIEDEYKTSSRGRYLVPCPLCGHAQALEWGERASPGGIRFKRDGLEVLDVWYQCEICKGRINEHMKTAILRAGRWIHEYPRRKKRGYWINGLYSPLGMVSWEQIVREFLASRKNQNKLKVWYNTRLAMPWTNYTKRDESKILALRDERPRDLVPSVEIIALTGAIDTQDDGFYFEVRAWGAGIDPDSWQIREGFVESFDALEEIFIHTRYKNSEDGEFIVGGVLIDSGGHRTYGVYEWAGKFWPLVVPIIGRAKMTTPFKYSAEAFLKYPGTNKPVPGSPRLLNVNVTYYKDRLARKLRINSADPGAWHLHRDADSEWGRQMIAEIVDEKTGLWINPFKRANHAWDASVYQLAAFDHFKLRFDGIRRLAEEEKQAQADAQAAAGGGWVPKTDRPGGWVNR